MAQLARLASALSLVARLLDELQVPYMVIGGVANLVWGNPRTTQDVDLTIELPNERISQVISALKVKLDLLPTDPEAFLGETHVLPVATREGVRIDLIRAGLPFEEAAIRRAVERIVGGVRVRVATAEDLIIHKLASTRPRDLEDAVGIIRRQRASLDRVYLDPLVQSLSETFDAPSIWETYEREMQPPS